MKDHEIDVDDDINIEYVLLGKMKSVEHWSQMNANSMVLNVHGTLKQIHLYNVTDQISASLESKPIPFLSKGWRTSYFIFSYLDFDFTHTCKFPDKNGEKAANLKGVNLFKGNQNV